MRQSAKEKIVVLAVSFALFVGGVLALSMDRGAGRTCWLCWPSPCGRRF